MNHLREQPLHQTLKQYRVLAIICIAFIGWLMADLVAWYKVEAHELSAESTAGLFGLLIALLGAFIRTVNNIREKHEE